MIGKPGDTWQRVRVQGLVFGFNLLQKETVNFDAFKLFQGAIMIIH